MTAKPIDCLQQANAILGEGPLWHVDQGALYWIDILRPAIYRFVPGIGQTGNWPMPSAVGAMGFCDDGRLIVALENEAVCFFDPITGDFQPFVDPVALFGPNSVAGRYNDGRVDALGNFWVGWLSHDRKHPGALFRIEPNGTVTKILHDPVAPNGLGWSPDGTIFYFTDSHINTIWAYDCDLKTGTLGQRKLLAKQDRSLGIFDGLSIDTNGNIWTALYGGGAVVQLSPDGQELTRINLPVRLVTSCCFGGKKLDNLMITTAIRGQSPADLVMQPLAGAIFGLPSNQPGQVEYSVKIQAIPK